MAAHFLSSPATERNEQSRLDKTNLDVSFSEAMTFMSPIKTHDLLQQLQARNTNGVARLLATPRARNSLGERKNGSGKSEFTPLLKSATQNRLRELGQNGDPRINGLRTPAALKPGFKFDGTPLPEPSELSNSSVVDDGTPIPPVASSSLDLSTPMPLAKHGEGGIIENGNVLTLKEQELRLEQIDKENFGLKLKIHFLEENLKRSGPEANQIAIRENSELKSNKMLLERELKKYQKSLKIADSELEQYRQQLLDYADKVKRRHVSEVMQEEMDELRRGAEEREAEILVLQEQLGRADNVEQELEKLRGDLEDADMELREKDELLEKQNEELEDLRARKHADAGEPGDKDRLIQEQADLIEELRDELRRTTQNKDDELDSLADRLEAAEVKHEAALNTLQDKNDEIVSLEARLRLAEASSNNQTELAQQAAHDVREQLRTTTRDKDAEISHLQARLALVNDAQSQVEESSKQAAKASEEAASLRRTNDAQVNELQRLRQQLASVEDEAKSLQKAIIERDSSLRELEYLRASLSEREGEVASLQKASEAQRTVVEELKAARSRISDQERQLATLKTTLDERTTELEVLRQTENEPDSQLEAVQNIVRERDNDLEAVRESANAARGKLEEVQRLADERLAALEEMKEDMASAKQLLEEEIQVLESSLDDAEQARDSLQAKVVALEREMKASYDLQKKAEPLEKDLRTAQRENATLQEELAGLERALEVADKERTSLQAKIASLTHDLQGFQQTASKHSPGKLERQSEELKELQSLLKSSTVELEALRSRVAEKDARIEATNAETASLLKEKDRKLRALQQAQQRHAQDTQTLQLQLANLGAGEATLTQLRDEIIDGERKHAAELKGLARQIQWLRAKGSREQGFREALCYEKKWLLMQITMFGACNKEHLHLIQEMGISPDQSFHDRRPHLKTVGLMVIACLRMRKKQQEWAANRKLHESLMRKLEGMRRQGLRKSVAGVR